MFYFNRNITYDERFRITSQLFIAFCVWRLKMVTEGSSMRYPLNRARDI